MSSREIRNFFKFVRNFFELLAFKMMYNKFTPNYTYKMHVIGTYSHYPLYDSSFTLYNVKVVVICLYESYCLLVSVIY